MYTHRKRREEELVVQEVGAEALVYDLRDHRIHRLGAGSLAVWRRCDGVTDSAALLAALECELGEPVTAEWLELALGELRRTNLLSGEPAGRVSRREAGKRLAGAVALPLIATLVAPTAAEAGSCKSFGATCSTSTECCSGICVNNACN